MLISANRRVLVAAVVVALLAGSCQSTSQGSAGSTAPEPAYPHFAGSPGLTESTVTVAVAGHAERSAATWELYGPVYAALLLLVDGINADGGILGRQLEALPAYDGYQGDEQTSLDAARALCGLAVQEHSSFALQGYTTFAGSDLLERAGCVGPERTINILRARLVSAGDLEALPDVVAPYALDDITGARLLVQRLSDEGFFDGAAKVGVLNPGGSYGRIVEDVIVEELAAIGIEDPHILVGEVGPEGWETDATANSNALRLKTEQVDRIVYFNDEVSGSQTIAAMSAQGFTPPLGTLDNVFPEIFLEAPYNYPAENLWVVSTLGGYSASGTETAFATIEHNDATRRCIEASEATGIALAFGATAPLLAGCDVLTLTEAALEASEAEEPSTAAFFAGLAELTEFESAFGMSLDFSHGRTGAAQVWFLRGSDSCACLDVVSGPHPIPRD
jgi:Periplasmic binding protein